MFFGFLKKQINLILEWEFLIAFLIYFIETDSSNVFVNIVQTFAHMVTPVLIYFTNEEHIWFTFFIFFGLLHKITKVKYTNKIDVFYCVILTSHARIRIYPKTRMNMNQKCSLFVKVGQNWWHHMRKRFHNIYKYMWRICLDIIY